MGMPTKGWDEVAINGPISGVGGGVGASSAPTPDVVIVGAGVVGCTIAWALTKAGRRVLLIDRSDPATAGASFGNVGHIATEQLQPLPGGLDECLNPDVIGNVVSCGAERRQRQQHRRRHRRDHSVRAACARAQISETAAIHWPQARCSA